MFYYYSYHLLLPPLLHPTPAVQLLLGGSLGQPRTLDIIIQRPGALRGEPRLDGVAQAVALGERVAGVQADAHPVGAGGHRGRDDGAHHEPAPLAVGGEAAGAGREDGDDGGLRGGGGGWVCPEEGEGVGVGGIYWY